MSMDDMSFPRLVKSFFQVKCLSVGGSSSIDIVLAVRWSLKWIYFAVNFFRWSIMNTILFHISSVYLLDPPRMFNRLTLLLFTAGGGWELRSCEKYNQLSGELFLGKSFPTLILLYDDSPATITLITLHHRSDRRNGNKKYCPLFNFVPEVPCSLLSFSLSLALSYSCHRKK